MAYPNDCRHKHTFLPRLKPCPMKGQSALVRGQQTSSTAKATETALCKPKRHTAECDGSTLCGAHLSFAITHILFHDPLLIDVPTPFVLVGCGSVPWQGNWWSVIQVSTATIIILVSIVVGAEVYSWGEHNVAACAGLDARAAAIVMRSVKNTVRTGRTVVCTIHQPSLEIFQVTTLSLSCLPLVLKRAAPQPAATCTLACIPACNPICKAFCSACLLVRGAV